jgi:hypothetical protein
MLDHLEILDHKDHPETRVQLVNQVTMDHLEQRDQRVPWDQRVTLVIQDHLPPKGQLVTRVRKVP